MNAPVQVITQPPASPSPAPTPYWGARLRLDVLHQQQRSVLSRVQHEGPLRIQRPFYPEGPELCHLYLLHPPGGLVSGDHLRIAAHLGPDAQALVTTPSAGKVYRANAQGTAQVQQIRLQADAGATLEWLPQENILFDQAAAELETEIHLHPSARLVAWELTCLGRHHSQEPFARGSLKQRLSVWSQGVPLYVDHFALTGGNVVMQAPWGLQRFACLGTAILGCGDLALPAINALVDRIRTDVPSTEHLKLAATRLRSLVVVRLLGADTEAAKQALERVWTLARPILLERPASLPRIWNT